MATETAQTAPAPAGHFTQTEILPGPTFSASCPCGWRQPAVSHEHSVRLGREHQTEARADE